jgi:hypothetical protein
MHMRHPGCMRTGQSNAVTVAHVLELMRTTLSAPLTRAYIKQCASAGSGTPADAAGTAIADAELVRRWQQDCRSCLHMQGLRGKAQHVHVDLDVSFSFEYCSGWTTVLVHE